MIIYLDFDGTVVEHEYPKIGRNNYGCIDIIKKLQDAGHDIILNTYRADCNDGTLEDALSYINEDYWMFSKDEDITMNPINKHTPLKIFPSNWNLKEAIANGVMFIDDIANGIPLKPSCMVRHAMVDWDVLDKEFEENGVYNEIL